MKKVFYFLLSLVFLSLVLFLVWWFFLNGKTQGIPFTFPKNPFGLFNTPTSTDTSTTTSIADQLPTGNASGDHEDDTGIPVMLHIWNKPTAGFTFVSDPITIISTSTTASGTEVSKQKTATTTRIMFMDRTTGHIYKETLPLNTPFKVTNTTLPGMHDVYFLSNGTFLVARYLRNDNQTIATLIADIPQTEESASPQALQNVRFLPDNILSIAVAPNHKSFSYLVKTATGSTLYSYTPGKGSTLLLISPLSEWNISYNGNNPILTQKSSAFEKGYSFALDESMIAGGKTGFAFTPNPVTASYLGSMWSSTGLVTFISSLRADTTHILSLKTLAEKCAWTTSGMRAVCAVPKSIPFSPFGLPDDWYQGMTSFSDDLYTIAINPYTETKILPLSDTAGENIDGKDFYFSSNDYYLGFINKINEDLWLVRTGVL